MKIQRGDVFRIKTNIGFGFLQHIEMTIDKTHYVRVLDFVSKDGNVSQVEVNKPERWCTEFILNIAFRRKLVERVGNFMIPLGFKVSKYARGKHIIPNELSGWVIVNRNTGKLTFKEKLTEEELKLSPHGIMNDTYIIERLEENWSLENWK